MKCDPHPFVRPYVRPFVRTSGHPSVRPPPPNFFGIVTSIGQEIWFLPYAGFFALTIYQGKFWHDQVRSEFNFKVQLKYFKFNSFLVFGFQNVYPQWFFL